MMILGRNSILGFSIVLILICTGIFAGCLTNSGSGASSQQIPAGTGSAQADITPPAAMTKTSIPDITTSLPYGVTVSYPYDWTKQELQETAIRDYGRTTTNIVNFFSPRENLQDPKAYAVFSIDVDSNPSKDDLERYFNLATIALQRYWGGPFEITKHDYQLKISNYKSYRLDFHTPKSGDRVYIFTDVKGTIYIFSAKNPWADDKWIENIYKSIKIVPLEEVQQVRR